MSSLPLLWIAIIVVASLALGGLAGRGFRRRRSELPWYEELLQNRTE